MTTNAFVKACRGYPDEPPETSPLSWLRSAIDLLGDPKQFVALHREDPGGYSMMMIEVEALLRNLTVALAHHNAGQPDPDAMRCAICGFIVDTSQPAAKPTAKPRGRPEISLSPEALAAAEMLSKLDF